MHKIAARCYTGKTETNEQLEIAVKEANERLAALHHLERQSVRSALIEERGRLCLFVCGLKPVMVSTVRFVYVIMIICVFTMLQRYALNRRESGISSLKYWMRNLKR